VCRVLGSTGVGTRILRTNVLNTLIVGFIISNRDFIFAENEMGENNPKSCLRVYNRRRAKGEDIFSLIHSNCVMADDLRGEIKHRESLKNILDADRDIREETYVSKDSFQSRLCFGRVSWFVRIRRELNFFNPNLYRLVLIARISDVRG